MPRDYWEQQAQDEAEANTGAAETVLHAATGIGGSLAGGLGYLGSLGLGRSPEDAEKDRAGIASALTYSPRTAAGKGASNVVDTAGSYLGQKEGQWIGPRATDTATSLGLPPSVAGGVGATAETLANLPQYLLPVGIKSLKGRVLTPETAETARAPVTLDAQERAPYFEINDPQAQAKLGITPEEQDKPASPAAPATDAQETARETLFRRLGLKEVRESAVTADAQAAADDFDSTKYTGTPMGDRMRPLIQSERQALVDSATGIVKDTEARVGTDQSARKANGKALAAPMDALSDHIESATNQAYATAKAQSGDTPIQLPTLEAALKDRTLNNQLLAQGKENFIKGAQSQLDDFKANNPEGLTVAHAEQYRQFLNSLWKTNPQAVGTLKDALDADVSNQVGSDVFGPARQLHQLGKVLLDTPKGVSSTFGKDPLTPVNRSTAFEDIPDKLMDLPSDQFNNVLNTYRMMPDQLQPQAQRAISTLQGHAVNRLLDTGAKYDVQWNKKGVNNEIADNSENLKNLFADRPDLSARVKDIIDGGEALRFNPSYRGAHAQASNMIRQGVGATAQLAGATLGGTVGTYLGGPGFGTTAGAVAGKVGASKMVGAIDSALAKRGVEARVRKLDEP